MTYQRNIQLQDCLDKGFQESVQEAQVGARDHDEAENDRGALTDVAPVRPLHAAQLVDDMAQERDDAGTPTALACDAPLLADDQLELVRRGLDRLLLGELDRL